MGDVVKFRKIKAREHRPRCLTPEILAELLAVYSSWSMDQRGKFPMLPSVKSLCGETNQVLGCANEEDRGFKRQQRGARSPFPKPDFRMPLRKARMKGTDPNLASLTDAELAQFFESTLDGSRGYMGDAFYRNLDFVAEIDRRVLESYGKEN